MADESRVNVINPSGDLVSLPASEVDNAVNTSGYKLASDVDTQAYENQNTYGSGSETLKAFAEGAARGATFSGSTWIEKKLGVDPEAIKQRQIQNPAAAFAGELTGAIGSVVAAPAISPVGLVSKGAAGVASKALPGAAKVLANPETATLAQKVLASGTTTGLGSAIEGAAFGAGQTVHEAALGDLDDNTGNIDYSKAASSLMHNVGYGTLIGGGLGAGIGLAGGAIKYRGGAKPIAPEIKAQAARDTIAEDTAALMNQSPEAGLAPQADIPIGGEIPGIPSSLEVSPTPVPQTIKDIDALIKKGEQMGYDQTLSQRPILEEAIKNTPDTEFPVHALQLQSLDDPYYNKMYKTLKESGAGPGPKFAKLEYLQKQEAVQKIKNIIKDLAPGSEVTDDIYKAGQKLEKSLASQYKEEKLALKPFWESFDQSAANNIPDRSVIMPKLAKDIDGISELIEVTPDGYKIAKYSPGQSVSKAGYDAVKDVVDILNQDEVTIKQLRNVRNKISDRLSSAKSGNEIRELSSMKRNLMDVMQDNVQAFSPDMEVREGFKRYAINETRREAIENILRGDLVTGEGQVLEGALNKLFSNTAAVKDAKELLGPAKFNEALADYMMTKVRSVSDPKKNFFSSNRFDQLLRKDKSGAVLREAFSHDPQALDKITQWNNKMVILPDAPMANPSGTAPTKTLLEDLAKVGKYLTPEGMMKLPGDVGRGVVNKVKSAIQEREINQALQSVETINAKASKAQALGNLERMKNKMLESISSSAKNVFKGLDKVKEPAIGVTAPKLAPTKEEKKERKKKIKDLSSKLDDFMANPNLLLDTIDNSTKGLYAIAPGVAGDLQMSLSMATYFLASKIPQLKSAAPLSAPMEPSDTEIAKFNRYYEVVQNPMKAMEQLENGTLTTETLETLDNVFPSVYKDMRMAVMQEMGDYISKKDISKIPYKKKMSLSLFLGQDLTESLSQQNIASNQIILMGDGAQQNQNEMIKADKMSKDGKAKLSMAQNALTPMQKSSMRMS